MSGAWLVICLCLGWFRVFQRAMLPISIAAIYWRDGVGPDMSDLFTLAAVFGAFVAVMEFLSGFLAGRIGYWTALGRSRASAILGYLILGWAPNFLCVRVAELFLAALLCLTSGANSALLYESCYAETADVEPGGVGGVFYFLVRFGRGIEGPV